MEMRHWLVGALVWAVAWPALGGTVEGTVEVSLPARAKRTAPDRYGPGGLKEKPPKTQDIAEVENVVIWVVDLITPAEKPPRARIGQVEKTFVPYVTAIRTGTTVDFPNGDKIFHSVYSESGPRKFHLPEYPQGQSRSVTFDKPGHVELFCAIHSHMNAHILVLPNQHFARPKKTGAYRLENLPAGKLKLQAWHPKLGAVTRVIEVPEEGTVKLSFTLK